MACLAYFLHELIQFMTPCLKSIIRHSQFLSLLTNFFITLIMLIVDIRHVVSNNKFNFCQNFITFSLRFFLALEHVADILHNLRCHLFYCPTFF